MPNDASTNAMTSTLCRIDPLLSMCTPPVDQTLPISLYFSKKRTTASSRSAAVRIVVAVGVLVVTKCCA